MVQKSLTDLILAIEGTIIMNEGLKDIFDNMFDARLPTSWRKISWESSTLGFWFSEFLERDKQFRNWCFEVNFFIHFNVRKTHLIKSFIFY